MSVRVGARVAPSTGVRKLRRPVATAAAPSFNPLTGWTTDPVHGVWASDPLWTPPADAGAVSSWRNGGSVGGDLVQATGSKQPTYRASTAAYNNQPTVQSDGTDDFLRVAFSALTQPLWIVLVANYGNTTTANKHLCDGGATGRCILYNDASTTHRFFAGAALDTSVAITADPRLHVVKFNGASSTYTLDGTLVKTGNTGTSGLDGATLFSNSSGSAGFNGGHIAYYAIFGADPTAQPEWADFVTWVETTYGLTIA